MRVAIRIGHAVVDCGVMHEGSNRPVGPVFVRDEDRSVRVHVLLEEADNALPCEIVGHLGLDLSAPLDHADNRRLCCPPASRVRLVIGTTVALAGPAADPRLVSLQCIRGALRVHTGWPSCYSVTADKPKWS